MGEAEALLAALASRDHLTRIGCAQRLREGGADEATLSALLDRGLGDRRPNVVAEVSRLAGELGRAEVGERLEALASDHRRPVRVRKAAVGALGLLERQEALGAIATVADHPNAMLRRAAMEAAGRLGTGRACGLLLGGLSDVAWQVRKDAAIGLGGVPRCAAPRALDGLERALGVEADTGSAEQMLRSVAELGGVAPGVSARAAGVLVAWLQQPGEGLWRLHKASARGLGELGALSARPVLVAALAGDPPAPVAGQILWSLARLGGASR